MWSVGPDGTWGLFVDAGVGPFALTSASNIFAVRKIPVSHCMAIWYQILRKPCDFATCWPKSETGGDDKMEKWHLAMCLPYMVVPFAFFCLAFWFFYYNSPFLSGRVQTTERELATDLNAWKLLFCSVYYWMNSNFTHAVSIVDSTIVMREFKSGVSSPPAPLKEHSFTM